MQIIILLIIVFLLMPVALIREKIYAKSHPGEFNMKLRFAVVTGLKIICLVFFLAIGYLYYETEYKKTEIVTYEKEPYELSVYQIGTPSFPFGDGRCRIVLSEKGKVIEQEDIRLANDGKWPNKSNFSVRWNSDNVEITVHGEEQVDELNILYFSADNYHELSQPQEMKVNLISWNKDSFVVIVNDAMDNTVFPVGTELTVQFDENTYFIDLDGSVVKFNPHRGLFEPTIERKLQWVEGMVIQIEFTGYDYRGAKNSHNMALGRRIENVDVIVVESD